LQNFSVAVIIEALQQRENEMVVYGEDDMDAILQVFIANPEKRFTNKEIAKLSDTPPKICIEILKKFVADGRINHGEQNNDCYTTYYMQTIVAENGGIAKTYVFRDQAVIALFGDYQKNV